MSVTCTGPRNKINGHIHATSVGAMSFGAHRIGEYPDHVASYVLENDGGKFAISNLKIVHSHHYLLSSTNLISKLLTVDLRDQFYIQENISI